MLELKNYQKQTLEKLSAFLDEARLLNHPQEAFQQEQDAQGYASEYQPIPQLEDVPYICLRLPTGAGKTLLASYAIGTAADHYLEQDYPIVLWMVPTDIIRKQTLAVLADAKKENRRVLDKQFSGQVRVYDIEDFANLRPQDLEQRVNIFITTFAAFRIEKEKEKQRSVYKSNENLAPCFRVIPAYDYLDKDSHGNVLHSFRNLLAYYRPLMIIDEAHNHASPLSIEVLQRLRPSAIIEWTATPAKNSNVLYKVSASELKAEDMIKLPIQMEEHRSWEDAVTTAVQEQHQLEELAKTEKEYVRPIVLFQAEKKDREVTVSVLYDYLVNELQVKKEEIAIATGTQRELDGIDLFNRNTPIRYIITVQALKEGWDCSFAYIFCSVATVASSKDAEQLLGRVLRMPYAKLRQHEKLNRAYAHIAVASWREAVGKIKDNLLSMGFEDEEVQTAVHYEQSKLAGMDDDGNAQKAHSFSFHTQTAPNLSTLNLALQGYMEIKEDKGEYLISVHDVEQQDLQELQQKATEVFANPQDQNELIYAVLQTGVVKPQLSPSERGETFAVPQLCLCFDGEVVKAEKEDFLPEGWRLTDYPADLAGFQLDQENHLYIFNIENHKITESMQVTQGNLGLGHVTQWTVANLVCWLMKKIKAEDILPADMSEYFRRVIENLQAKNISLADLVRFRFVLVKKLNEQIAKYREQAYDKGVQEVLFAKREIATVKPEVGMAFQPNRYPAKSFYRGSVRFHKHFYPLVGNMDSAEEIRCAQCIDANPHVVTWVRNIPRDAVNSFWLPTHQDKFYPDFVAKLDDGRVAAIEYKGAHLLSTDDSKEKDLIGELWAANSQGKCLFLMATDKDEQGRDLSQQIADLLKEVK